MHQIEAATFYMFKIAPCSMKETIAVEDIASPYYGEPEVLGK